MSTQNYDPATNANKDTVSVLVCLRFETYMEALSELSNIKGIDVKTEKDVVGHGSVAIDFALNWQEDAPAQKHPLRYNAVENSAIILQDNMTVSEAQLRMPPIPTENNPKDETESALERSLSAVCPYGLSVRLAKDGTTWTPHIRIENVNRERLDDVVVSIEQIWSRYRAVAKPDGNINS